MPKKILIVGGVAGGATAAARLRRLDETAELILFERGAYISYANCGLPYYIGGEIKRRQSLFVASKESIAAKYNVDIRDLSEVVRIDRQNREVVVLDHRSGESYSESYDKLILSTGSSPFVPPLAGREAEGVFTIWTVPDTDAIAAYIERTNPQRALVVGGGFIGLEMCENLKLRGLEVSLVEMAPQVLPPLDADMAKLVSNQLCEQGVKQYLGKSLTAISSTGKQVTLSDGSELATDLIILAIGVRPNSKLAQEAGLQLNQRGGIVVDEFMQSSDPNIFAVGDVIEVPQYTSREASMIPLAGPANKQGRAVAANVLGLKQKERYEGSLGTSIAQVFALSCAMTGLNEKQLQRQGLVLDQDYGLMLSHPLDHASYYPGALPMTIKLIFALRDLNTKVKYRKGQILGAQIVGYAGVDKRIDSIATCLHFKGDVYDLSQLELAYAPPYSSAKDPVNLAAFAACNVLEGLSQAILFEDYARSPKGRRILDVREEPEVQSSGLMPEAIHIPLSQLRGRLSELDKQTEYIATCAVGIRGYIAERILRQEGFKVKNLLGGIRMWREQQYDLAAEEAKQEQEKAQKEAQSQVLGQGETATAPAASLAASSGSKAGVAAAKSSYTSDDGFQVAAAAELAPPQELDVCGLSCPGPIVQVAKAMAELQAGGQLLVTATDPGFAKDIACWCSNTGNVLLAQAGPNSRGEYSAQLGKGLPPADLAATAAATALCACSSGQNASGSVALGQGVSAVAATMTQASTGKEKTMIVFSGDLDKAIASFIIACGAAAMGNKVNLFFTFWGLNILRKSERVPVKKDFMSRMFAAMMPRGTKKLGLSQMNFAGLGSKMIRSVMKKKHISSLEELMSQAQELGVRLTACQMSMDVMGISKEELIDGVELAGVAAMLDDNDRSNMNLFIS